MQTQRKVLVAAISLFAFLTASAYGALGNVTDDMHWKIPDPPGVSADGTTQYVATCENNCDDDMHW